MINHNIISKYYLLIILLLITIILFFSYYNTLINGNNTENFTPYIRQIYRPKIRNARIYATNMYNDTKNKMSNILRKVKIL